MKAYDCVTATRRVLPSHGMFHAQRLGLNNQRNPDPLPTRSVFNCVTAAISLECFSKYRPSGTEPTARVQVPRLVFRSALRDA